MRRQRASKLIRFRVSGCIFYRIFILRQIQNGEQTSNDDHQFGSRA